MVRMTRSPKSFGEKIYNRVRTLYPSLTCYIYVTEHASSIHVKLDSVNKDPISATAVSDALKEVLHREPTSSFGTDDWCALTYLYR